MVFFIAVLAIGTLAGGAWCAAALLPAHIRAWWRAGLRIRASAVVLLAVVAGAVALRATVPPHHAMYVDEPWYADAGCNVARHGRLQLCDETWPGPRCKPYEKAPGWPVLIAAWAKLAGCATTRGIELTRVFGVATVVLLALAVRCAGGSWWQAALAAGVLAVHPVHVAWSATGETNVAGAAVFLCGLIGALIFLRSGRRGAALLAIAGLALATAMRTEALLPALAAAAVLATAAPALVGRRVAVAAALAGASALAALAGTELWAMNEEISGGAFFSLRNATANLTLLATGGHARVQAPILVLAAAGAVIGAVRHQMTVAALLLAVAIAGALPVLAYDRFDPRMLLAPTVVLLTLGGLAVPPRPPPGGGLGGAARAIGRGAAGLGLVLVLWLLWREPLRAAAEPPETQLLETRIAVGVGTRCAGAAGLIIAEQPTVLGAAGCTRVMAAKEALADPERLARTVAEGQPVYFLSDMFCEPGFQGADRPGHCDAMAERFTLLPVVEERLNQRRYVLYRLRPGPGGAVQ